MAQLRDLSVSARGSKNFECEEMATRSSVLTWGILWTEEPGGLQSVGSQSRTRLKRLSISSSIVVQTELSVRRGGGGQQNSNLAP